MKNTTPLLVMLAFMAVINAAPLLEHPGRYKRQVLLDLNGGPGVADRNTLGATVDDLP